MITNKTVFKIKQLILYQRRTLLSTIENTDNNVLDLCKTVLMRTLLFGSNQFNTDAYINVLNAAIDYILSTKRLDEPLFQ